MANFYAFYPPSGGGSTNASIGTNGATAPTSSTEVGGVGPDGNLHPISTDNSGVQNVNVVSSTLPAGGATAANQTTEITRLTSIDTKIPAQGQALAAASTPVVLPATQITALTPPTTVTVQQPTAANLNATVVGTVAVSNFPATQPVSGTVTVTQATGTNLHTVVDSGSITLATGANTIGSIANTSFIATQATPANLQATVSIAAAQTLANVTTLGTITNALPTGTNTLGSVKVTDGTNVATVKAASTAAVATDTAVVVAISPNNAITAAPPTATTASVTSVAGSATSVQLLASNTARKGMTVTNESTAVLYLKLGTTASTSSYTVQIPAGAYYELPFNQVYTGRIDGIWTAANGNARLTEVS